MKRDRDAEVALAASQDQCSTERMTTACSNTRPGEGVTDDMTMEYLKLICGSGFVRVNELQLVSVLHCNASREANVSWRLTIDSNTPTRLLNMLRPKPTKGPDSEGRVQGGGTGKNTSAVSLAYTIRHLRYVQSLSSGRVLVWCCLCICLMTAGIRLKSGRVPPS